MTKMKLSKDEKTILIALYKDGYRYLARDECGRLNAYTEMPLGKSHLVWYIDYYSDSIDLSYTKVLFPHIKWEEEEPTSIKELLNANHNLE